MSKVFPSCFFSRSFQSDCTYVLVRDAVAGLFTILFGTQGPCDLQAANCKKSITVLVEDDTYHLDAAGSFCSEAPRRVRQSTAPTNDLPLFIFFSNENTDDGTPRLQRGQNSVAIPGVIDGMVVERVAHYVILRAEGLGFTVKWDTKVSRKATAKEWAIEKEIGSAVGGDDRRHRGVVESDVRSMRPHQRLLDGRLCQSRRIQEFQPFGLCRHVAGRQSDRWVAPFFVATTGASDGLPIFAPQLENAKPIRPSRIRASGTMRTCAASPTRRRSCAIASRPIPCSRNVAKSVQFLLSLSLSLSLCVSI